ncbi:MAG: choice-of-anchor tandem repeat GloVer-containing protein, partial [Candidatus Cybelea sp.]
FDGTVFSVTTSGTETVLHSFGGSGDGAHPDASLLNVNGTLYGTTGGGGAHGDGTVFSLLP